MREPSVSTGQKAIVGKSFPGRGSNYSKSLKVQSKEVKGLGWREEGEEQ